MILFYWDICGNLFVGLGVGLIGFFILLCDVNLCDIEFLFYVIRFVSWCIESLRFIYF